MSDPDLLANAPVWLAAIVIILRVVFDFVRDFTGGKKDNKQEHAQATNKIIELLNVLIESVSNVHQMTSDLRDWHNVVDEDGVRIWYVRRSLSHAIENLSKGLMELSRSIDAQNMLTQQLVKAIAEQDTTLEEIKRNMT